MRRKKEKQELPKRTARGNERRELEGYVGVDEYFDDDPRSIDEYCARIHLACEDAQACWLARHPGCEIEPGTFWLRLMEQGVYDQTRLYGVFYYWEAEEDADEYAETLAAAQATKAAQERELYLQLKAKFEP
ncbi:MAG: hypothetical protein WC505_07050 [Patescibacteria group bacterium]